MTNIAKGGKNRMDNNESCRQRRFEDIFTVDDLMDYLVIGRSTAYSLLRSGQIKCIKIGRNYKIPKESVLNFVNATQK